MEQDSIIYRLGGVRENVIGQMDGLFYTLAAFVVVDYITGICVAIRNRKLSSDVGPHGIAKKISIFALVLLSHIIGRFLLDDDDILSTVTTGFCIANEAMSIMENVGKVGCLSPPKVAGLPIFLKHVIMTRTMTSKLKSMF